MQIGQLDIVLVTPRYYPHTGGVEYVVKSVAERLAKRGYKVGVLSGEHNIGTPTREEINGVTVFRWPVSRPYGLPRNALRLSKFVKSLLLAASVVHFHNVHNIFPVFVLLHAKPKARVVMTMHYHGSGHSAIANLLWPIWRRVIVKALRHVDRVHAVSTYESELIKKHFAVEAVVVEHGVEEWLRELMWEPDNYILYAGRLERYKNVERLARIIRILQSWGYDVYLKIIGEGSYKEKLLVNIKKLGVKFQWHTFQPYRHYVDTLRKSLAVANLSKREAFGLTINEAHAIGVPAVVSSPWGLHFAHRSRTLVITQHEKDIGAASKIVNFLNSSRMEPRPIVPSWNEVVDKYIQELYGI